MKKIRVGVIGMGVMGITHARIYQGMPEAVELVGLVENIESKQEELEQKFGVPCFSSYAQLIDKGIDAVSICTPDDMHMDFILASLKNKIKVLVEKPLEVTAEKCRKIIAATPGPSYIMVGHTLRFDPRLIPLKKIIQEGKLGKIVAINIKRSNTKSNGRRIGKRTSVAWFLGIHDIDIILWLTGKKVKNVSSLGVKVFSDFWDYTTSQLLFEDGAIGVMENHWLLPDSRPVRINAELKIIGETGMLEADLNTNVSFTGDEIGQSYIDTFLQPLDEDDIPRGDMYREIQCFIECVRENKKPPVTALEALKAVEVIEMVEQSILNHNRT